MLAVVLLSVWFEVPAAAQEDPLASWNDGPARTAIIEFVEAVTTESGEDFVPPQERIAVFDNDGTLWLEQPYYTQVVFVLGRNEQRQGADQFHVAAADQVEMGEDAEADQSNGGRQQADPDKLRPQGQALRQAARGNQDDPSIRNDAVRQIVCGAGEERDQANQPGKRMHDVKAHVSSSFPAAHQIWRGSQSIQAGV
jgi:hypothetical protein